MESFQHTNKKSSVPRYHTHSPKKLDTYGLSLLKGRENKLQSRVQFGKKDKAKKQLSRLMNEIQVPDSGIEHLEYLKEKNTLARKRLLELQKRLVEINSKDKNSYQIDELKLPQVLDQLKETGAYNLLQKYSSANLNLSQKNSSVL